MRFALPGWWAWTDAGEHQSDSAVSHSRRHWCTATRAKKGAIALDRAEDSTIGGEWRN
jgi:hypothetical protein